MAVLLTVGATAPAVGDEPTVKEFLAAYVKAFNSHDLDAVAGMWAENCTHIDRETGQRTEGRAAVRADLADVFKKSAKARLAGTVDRVRLIKPDVARVEGTITTSVPDEEPTVAKFTGVLVKLGDRWQIDSVEESATARPATAADALRELDWLEGTWQDDSKDTPVVSTIRWSTNRTFLIRSFATKDGDKVNQLGTQVIGWDPRSQQIRSWTFNSDGSFGDGIWSKSGADWMVKSSQTLADGRAASGTYVITRVDRDKLTLRLIGHEIDGDPVPESDPATIVRVADQPAADGKETAPKK
jgi:uncharacterized protein (TIGR02246 family)